MNLMSSKLDVNLLLKHFRWRVVFTWFLVLVENALLALIPLFIGRGIDALLADETDALWEISIVMAVLIVVSVGRRIYDTRAYGTMRVWFGSELVRRIGERQTSLVNARLDMSREMVDFLEEHIPELLTAIVQIVISIIILWFYDAQLGVSALCLIVLLCIIYGLFHKRFYLLNSDLNAQKEQQVKVLEERQHKSLLSHLNYLRRHEIRLSDTEAILYGVIFAGMFAFILTNLWLASTIPAVTAGIIFAILSYSWALVESGVALPMVLQQWSRLSEIRERLNETSSNSADQHQAPELHLTPDKKGSKTNMIKKTTVYISILLSIVIGLWFVSYEDPALTDNEKSLSETTARSALAVEVETVKRGPVTEVVFADGNSQATRRELLRFENSGKVAYLRSNDDGGPLREGDTVKQGELLAELDRRIDDAAVRAIRAELDTVRAALANAKTEYERAKRLRAGGAIPESRFNSIETEYQQTLANTRAAEARSDQALASLRQLQIRAPFDGVVAFVNIREGQYVASEQFNPESDRSRALTTPIVVIDPSSFEIIVELPVVTGRRVKAGQNVYILDEGTLAHVQEYGFDSLKSAQTIDDLLINGRIGSISPAIDPGSRSVRARVVTDSTVKGLTDGGYVTVWIETDRRENVITTPMESLVYRGETAYAFVVDPDTNQVEQRIIKLGLIGEEGVEVTSGLQNGDIVATKGRFRLTTGMQVRAVNNSGIKQ